MSLTPARYDELEAEACRHLPNRLIQAARPTLFQTIGYPTRCDDERSLWRWADVMHEGRRRQDFGTLLGGALSAEEWSLWQKVALVVLGLTSGWGHPVLPHDALCRAFYAFRYIRALVKPPSVVVEIGPGSGYLSALLAWSGYNVVTVEVTQAFYLWQWQLFGFAPCGSEAYTSSHPDDPQWGAGPHEMIIHTPWWEFCKEDASRLLAQPVSLVTSNHCLAEMHEDAQHYVAMLCAAWCQRGAHVVIEGRGLSLPGIGLNVEEVFERHKVPRRQMHDVLPIRTPHDVGISEVEMWERDTLGQADVRTPDERWLASIHGAGYYS